MRKAPDSQGEIEERVLARFTDEVTANAVEGPHSVGPFHMARVWTRDTDREYHAHYHVKQGEAVEIFHNFSPFAVWLADEWRDLEIVRHGQRLDWAKTVIASILAIGGLGLVWYGFAKTKDVSHFVDTLIPGLLLAAGGYLFGSAARVRK